MIYILKDYLKALENNGLDPKYTLSDAEQSKKVTSVTFDSREAKDGTLFICKGANFRPQYAKSALASGAIACVGENAIEGADPFIVVNNIRHAMAILAQMFYENAPAELVTIGITGTKGKSTTAHFMRSVLDDYLFSSGRKETGLISTIETYDGVERFESHLTTPESLDVYKHCRNAVNSGMDHMIMELSSQALKYERVEGVHFNIGCFLNIGEDHISPVEHADFEDYFSSKLRIFDISDCVCVNSSSEHFERIKAYADGKCKVVTFGTDPEDDIFCTDIEKRDGNTHFKVRTPAYESEMILEIPGLYNVSNALGVVAMSYVLGIPEKYVRSGLQKAKVPGRNDVIESLDKNVVGIVSYAHNKLSFDATFQSVQVEYPGKKIIAVFGAAGGRAEIRRRDLPMTAEKYCDLILVTEDDPGTEPLEKICSEIAENISKCPFEVIYDRGEAIKRAVLDDSIGPRVIVATGKGDSSYMARGLGYVDYPSDVQLFREYISEYDRRVKE